MLRPVASIILRKLGAVPSAPDTRETPLGASGRGGQELFVDTTIVLDPEARRRGSVRARPDMWWLPDLGR